MDTKQRKTPETVRRSSRADTAGNTKAAPSADKTAPRKQSAVASQSKTAAAARKTRRTAPKKEPAARTQRQTAQASPPRRRPAPEIVYTPPKPFSRNRLLLRLATVVAVVIALTFGISIFFKVKTVTVAGAEKYTAWAVKEASGIQEGDNLLTFGEAKACAKIKAALPYVDDVRIGIKLPDTVNIWIEELDVVYSIRDQSGGWWLITADGEVVEQADSATAGQYTEVLGVLLSVPRAGEKAVALEPVAAPADAAGDNDETQITVSVTVPASQQLETALNILRYLEANGVIGEVVSVDVTDLSQMELWYGQQYQVKLGDTTQLSYKISCMKKAVDQLGSYQSGVLDASLTIWPEGVGYTPFP